MRTSHPKNILKWPICLVLLIVLLGVAACEPLTPASQAYPNPAEEGAWMKQSYNWQGDQLEINALIPIAPSAANVYLAQPEQPATIESARALALQFGIQGQVYQVQGAKRGDQAYLVTAGGAHIYVHSNNSFSYFKNFREALPGARDLTDEQVNQAVDKFMRSHGFEFEYQVEPSLHQPGLYYVVPQLDGLPLRRDYLMPVRLEILLGEGVEVLSVRGNLVSPEWVGAFDIRSPEEALQLILTNAYAGVVQFNQYATQVSERIWPREYPDGQSLTLHGQIHTLTPAEAGQPPLLMLDSFPLSGNTEGLQDMEELSLVEARGQFVDQNGSHTFQVASWKPSQARLVFTMGGFPQKVGNDIMVTIEGNSLLPLVDPPADLPLDMIQGQGMTIDGVLVEGRLDWSEIRFFPNGFASVTGDAILEPISKPEAFYQLDLLDTEPPIPPTAATSVPSVADQPPVGARFDGLRGTLQIAYYNQPGGTQRVEYTLISQHYPLIELELEGLAFQKDLHNQPVTIWGAIDRYDTNFGWNIPIVKVEKYELPFPGLDFQIVSGIQKQNAKGYGLLTVPDGTTYIMLDSTGHLAPGLIIFEPPTDQVLVEALIIPDETAEGYPGIRIFNASPALDPQTGWPMSLEITADTPFMRVDTIPQPNVRTSNRPSRTLIIDRVELVYFLPETRLSPEADDGTMYIQPVWRFLGHYSDGGEFEFLVQALTDEFLSPEIQILIQPK